MSCNSRSSTFLWVQNMCGPVNIHTPTIEGIGHTGGRGSKSQEILGGGGGGVVSEIRFPGGQV